MSYTPASAGAGALVPLATFDGTGLSEVDIVTRNAYRQAGAIFQSDFDEYVIEFLNLVPGTNAATFGLQMSANGGSSYDTGTNYDHAEQSAWINSSGGGGTASDSKLTIVGTTSSTASNGGASGTVRLFSPLSGSAYKNLAGNSMWWDTGSTSATVRMVGGIYKSTSAVNSCRVVPSSGTITSGLLRVYGVSKQSQVIASSAQGGGILLASFDATSAAEVDVTTRNASGFSGAIFQSDYDEYEVEILNALPATNAVSLQLQCSVNGGSTYDTGSNYNWGAHYDGSSASSTGYDFGNPVAAINLNGSTVTVANVAANGGVCGKFRIYNPLGAAYKRCSLDTLVPYSASTNFYRITGHGTYAVTTAVNAFRLLFSAGSFSAGTIRVYGIPKAGPINGGVTKIGEVVLTGTQASVSFTSIPQGYRNLSLALTARGDTAATGVDMYMQFNADTGTNYDREYIGANTTTAGANGNSATAQAPIAYIAAASSPANDAGSGKITIFNYASTNWNKNATSVSMNNPSTGAVNPNIIGFVWRSTAAITSLLLAPVAGNFVAGSVFSLYGES